jgi:hypothetical protein
MRRLLGTNAFWMHAPPSHDERRLQQPSSFGFAAAASEFNLPRQLHGGSNERPLLPTCDMSRNATGVQQLRRNCNDRQWLH